MTAKAKTVAMLLAILFGALLAGGCVGLGEQGMLSGLTGSKEGQRILEEPAFPPVAESYAAGEAHRTMGAPLRLNVPDRTANFTVNSVRSDLFSTPYVVASFPGGAIVAREFGKVLEANFRKPVGGEAPVAEMAVRIASVVTGQPSDKGPITSSLRLNIEVVKSDGKETAYSKRIDATATAPWTNHSQVPEAFYAALFDAIGQFMADWEQSGGLDAVARWAGDAGPGVVPAQLKAIAWEAGTGKGGVQRGRCTVACNGFEGFRAKHWANAQIAEACRTKLGNIEPERVRVVYDDERYDEAAGTWNFTFRCFPRSERVLDFNPFTEMGTVIGDLGLMKMNAEEASEVLKAYVFEEMRSHSGIVTSEHRKKQEAYVRFDGMRTDAAYNLLIIDFHLPR